MKPIVSLCAAVIIFAIPTLAEAATLKCSGSICVTDTKEAHADGCASLQEFTLDYNAPAGIKLIPSTKNAKEIEGSGSTHYVNAVDATATSLICKWHAEPKCFGDNGLSKGYCYISIAGALRRHRGRMK